MANQLSGLRARVGYKLGYAISTDSSPTQSEVDRWLNDGLDYVMNVLPAEKIQALISTDNQSIASVSAIGLPSDFVRIVSGWYSQDGSATKRRPLLFVRSSVGATIYVGATNTSYKTLVGGADSDNPVAWLEGSNLKFYPATTGTAAQNKVVIQYIADPGDFNDTTDINLSDDVLELIVDYAVAQAKLQEEQYSAYALLTAKITQTVNLFSQLYTSRRF